RLARLEPPGGAAEFLRYHEDLEGEEKGFASRSLEGDFLEGLADEGEQGGGVRLLTAHSSKGLEFDTVFLPRIEALYGYKGYPDLQGRGEDEIVPGWLDPDGGRDERGARAVTEDEERRLFYVACTRAERRLVLLGKLPGAKSSGVNYFVEARDDGTLDRVRTASEVLDHASERGVYVAGRGGDGLGELDVVTRADRAAAIRRDARRRAAEAMDLLDDPSAGEAELGAARRSIERATLDIAAAARGARGDELPGWLGDERGRAIASRLRERGEEEGDPYTRPLEAPLRLSFSHVDLYTACPRCYYARHVYGIEEARGASLVVGKVVHGAIEAFLLRQRLADAEGGAAPSGEDLLALGRSLALGELAGAGLSEAEVGQQLAQVGAQLRVYLERFHDADDEILEIERRLEVPLEVDGVRHTLVAKFDRLDRIEGGVRLIDYKTGAPSKKYVSPSASADLQLGIYRIALDAYFEGEVSGEAEYWLLATGEVGRVSLDRLREKSEKTVGTIETAARGMMAGRFDRDARGCRGLCELISGP
ncbi:MAG: PD-(D/E)XK nuclease family protein, partial [Planctomycetota bacterium]